MGPSVLHACWSKHRDSRRIAKRLSHEFFQRSLDEGSGADLGKARAKYTLLRHDSVHQQCSGAVDETDHPFLSG